MSLAMAATQAAGSEVTPDSRRYAACAVELWIDRAAKTGFKRHVDHVNRMSAAVRGTIDLGALSTAQRASLAVLLEAFAPGALARSRAELTAALRGSTPGR